jgi:NADPH-dependent F420 reductase
MSKPEIMRIDILGGSCREGKGLAYLWAKAGYQIIIGSRSQEKARQTAMELSDRLGIKAKIEGMLNLNAAKHAEIVVITVPYAAHKNVISSLKDVLRGKLLVDVTVPLNPSSITTVQLPFAGSAAMEAHDILGEEVQITTAFQNISFENLLQDGTNKSDVLVTGTSREARGETLKLVAAAGFVGWDAGPLENAFVVEGLTSILIGINKRYHSKTAGIRIIGVQAPGQLK